MLSEVFLYLRKKKFSLLVILSFAGPSQRVSEPCVFFFFFSPLGMVEFVFRKLVTGTFSPYSFSSLPLRTRGSNPLLNFDHALFSEVVMDKTSFFFFSPRGPLFLSFSMFSSIRQPGPQHDTMASPRGKEMILPLCTFFFSSAFPLQAAYYGSIRCTPSPHSS